MQWTRKALLSFPAGIIIKEDRLMNKTRNPIFSKTFWITLLWKQNAHHRHGVFMHTVKVTWHALRHGDFKMLAAALLHDIGKPVVAYQKPEDIEAGEYSFTDHEEKSYRIIKRWPFINDDTKLLVRYHYLIRDMQKHKTKDPKRYAEKKAVWDALDASVKEDLGRFLKYDDLGKR